MAKSKRTIEPGDHHEPEQPATSGETATSRQQQLIEEKKQRLEYMQWVQQLLRSTMTRRDIDHEAKKEAIIDELMKRGSPDDEIAYILTKKPGRDGNEYYGFTFTEMNDLKDEIGTLEMLGRKRSGFVDAENQRRQNQTGNDGHAGGRT